MFLLQLVYYGDLLVPTPAWVSYAPQAQIVGRQVRFLQTRADQGWKLDAAQLNDLCLEDPRPPADPRARTTPATPPAGPTAPRSCSTRRGRGTLRRGRALRTRSTPSCTTAAATCRSSASIRTGRSSAAGSRSGAVPGAGGSGRSRSRPPLHWLLEAMEAVASETYTSTSAPIQYAAVAPSRAGSTWSATCGARGTSWERWAVASRSGCAPAAWRSSDPVGAFYLFPDFAAHAAALRARGITTSRRCASACSSETGVAILPGSVFGRPPAELTARLAYVDFDGAQALAAAETLGLEEPISSEFLERYCGRILIAVDRICKWLDGCLVSRSSAARTPAAPSRRTGARARACRGRRTRSRTGVQPSARWRSMPSITRSGVPQMPCSSSAAPMWPP